MELHWWRWMLACAGLVGIVALLFAEENWRGKRAWQQCRRALEAKGQTLDWGAYVPVPVPPDDNFFDAPNMAAWFVGKGGSDLSGRLSYGRDDFLPQRDDNPALEATVVPPACRVNPEETDLLLDHLASVLTISPDPEKPKETFEPVVLPLIVLRDVPLIDAIKNLAQQDNLKFNLDPQCGFKESKPQPTISISWTNVTAHEALVAILHDYELFLVPDPNTSVARI